MSQGGGARGRESPVGASAELARVLRAQVPPRSGRWVPLPGYSYSITVPEPVPEEAMRFFISSLMTLYAIGAAAESGGTNEERQFVVLCRFTLEEGTLTFASYTPSPALVDFAMRSLPPTVPADHFRKLIDDFPMTVRQSCAIPNGVWAPVVVACRPADRTVLLTNANQLQSPDQFLEVGKCRTTSGFLNFLGTLMLKIESSGGETHMLSFANVESLLGHGLDPWIRWAHHAVQTSTVFSADRFYVNADDPEEYDYRFG